MVHSGHLLVKLMDPSRIRVELNGPSLPGLLLARRHAPVVVLDGAEHELPF